MKKKKILVIVLISIIIFLFIMSLILFLSNNKIENKSNLEKTEITGELIDDNYKLEDSGITGEDTLVDTTYSIYYTFLTEEEQKLYKQIYANIINLKETFIPIVDMNKDQILKVYKYVTYDNPELFWLSNGFTYKYKDKDAICKQITLRFNGLQYEYEKNKKLFDDSANSIIEEANNLTSDYEKELFVYNKIIKSATYDAKTYYNQTAYSTLVNGKTVCAGYSKAFQYVMKKLNIITYYVVGKANKEDHAWNIIKLDDGFYNVDLTWEEINITDKEYAATHERSSDSELLPSCIGKTYAKSLNKAPSSTKKKTTVTSKESKVENNSSDTTKNNNTQTNNIQKNNTTNNNSQEVEQESKSEDTIVEDNSIEIEETIPEDEEDSEYGKTIDVGEEIINYPYITERKKTH